MIHSQKSRARRRFKNGAIAGACVAVLTGCSSSNGTGAGESHSTRTVSELTPELAPVVASNQAFSWALYRELVREAPNDNCFFSPFSVSAALSMAAVGARGQTATEMQSVLGIPADGASYHQNFGALLSDLSGEHPGRDYQLDAANGLFLEPSFAIEPDFQRMLASDYHAEPTAVPFSIDPEAARETINAWVADRTQKTIAQLFSSGSIDGGTVLVLANASYFHAPWAAGFDPKDTMPGTFHAAKGDVTVPMMSGSVAVSVLRTAELSVAELDYRDHEVSLVVLEPAQTDGLPALEASLSSDQLGQLLAQLPEPERLPLALPRFELHTSVELSGALSALGMPSAFLGSADFSGISEIGGLYIGQVQHSAYVHVDESGTVASAATGVGIERTSAPLPLTLDHPFLFFIRDKLTGAILFAGRMLDPS